MASSVSWFGSNDLSEGKSIRSALIENDRVIDADVTAEDQKNVTQWATDRALDFIDRKHKSPSFCICLILWCTPLFASDVYWQERGGLAGRCDNGARRLYWRLSIASEYGIADNTFIVFTSDNGPWVGYGIMRDRRVPIGRLKDFTEGESAFPRFSGGRERFRPTQVRWVRLHNRHIADGRQIDWSENAGHKIDDKDIGPLCLESVGLSPHETFPHYYQRQLQAVRNERWKLVFSHKYRSLNGRQGGTVDCRWTINLASLALYDLNDPGETNNVINQYPEIYAELLAPRTSARAGRSVDQDTGGGVREASGPNDRKLIWY